MERVCRLLARTCDVEFAEPNYVYELETHTATPDEFLDSRGAWGQSFPDLWGLRKIEGVEAWSRSTGRGVVVAVIDSGLDRLHPDLAANVWQNPREIPDNGVDDDGNGYRDDTWGWNFIDDDNDPRDDMGHGTHVAGTIAAVEGNGIGIAGVAPDARVMAVKAFDSYGFGTLAQLVPAIEYAAANGARVINNSWGGFTLSESLRRALEDAHSRGCVITGAAGNAGTDMAGFYPAAHPAVISVGATDHEDHLASFSNFGPLLDVVAPGGGGDDPKNAFDSHRSILSLLASHSTWTNQGDILPLIVRPGYLRQAGTSMACPHVSGISALLLSRHPDWTAEQVRAALHASAEDLGEPGPDATFGHGRVNARRALTIENPLALQLDRVFVDTPRADIVFEGALGGAPPESLEVLVRVQSEGTFSPIAHEPGEAGTGELARIPVTPGVFQDGETYVFLFRVLEAASGLYLTESITLTDFRAIRVAAGLEGEFLRATETFEVSGDSVFGIASAAWVRKPGGVPSAAGVTIEQGGAAGPYRIRVSGSALPGAGSYALRLEDAATHAREVAFHLEATLFAPSLLSGDVAFMQLAELDGDPAREVVVSTPLAEGLHRLVVYEHTGNLLAGFPKDADPPAMVVDLNGDGRDEIVTTRQSFYWESPPGSGPILRTRTYLSSLDGSGNVRPGYPVSLDGAFKARAAADVDADGRLEVLLIEDLQASIILTGSAGGTASSGAEWAAVRLGAFAEHLAVGDLDRDGDVELVVRDGSDLLIASPDGTVSRRIRRPASLASGLGGGPLALADLDGDPAGDLEIVTSYRVGFGTAGETAWRAFDHDGRERPEFQISIPFTTAFTRFAPGFSLGDLTGDGRAELVIFRRALLGAGLDPAVSDPRLWAYERSNAILAGWPVSIPAAAVLSPRRVLSEFYLASAEPLVGDVNGDGRNDVVAVQDDGKVYAYDAGGRVLAGWPQPIALDSGEFPYQKIERLQLADVEGDGLADLLLARESWPDSHYTQTPPALPARSTLHLFSTWHPLTPYRQAWPFADHDPAMTRNLATDIRIGNRGPQFDPLPAGFTILTGETVTFDVVATDDDADAITITFEGPLPAGATLIDLGADPVAKSRRARFRWAPASASITSVAFTASDGLAVTRSRAVLITVNAPAVREEFTRYAQETVSRSAGWVPVEDRSLETIRRRAWARYSMQVTSAGVWELEVVAADVPVGPAYTNTPYLIQVSLGSRSYGTLSLSPADGERRGVIGLGYQSSRRYPKNLSITLRWQNGANTAEFPLRLRKLTLRKP